MEQYLMDTNVGSDYLSNSFPATVMQFMDAAINAIPNLSVITQIELLCWKTATDTEEKVKSFIADRIVLNNNPGVITQCTNLRKGKKIKTPDAIVAATTLAYGYTLINNNEKDFASIKGLKSINPNKL
ncbi:MAG: type II toxin-antitoxin system VapC family toxin [Chitinophagaceae bacterium]